MLLPHTCSLLFPFTTLFRSIAEPPQPVVFIPFSQKNNTLTAMTTVVLTTGDPANVAAPIRAAALRSEEHTSELQSLRHLVCRLLLEKKKNNTKKSDKKNIKL